MDYGKVLSGAWRITWQRKSLWLLGILSNLGLGFLLLINPGSFIDSSGWGGPLGFQVPPEVASFLAAACCMTLFVGIVIWGVAVTARGGLIAGANQAAEEGTTTFGSAWRQGAGRFWALFGIGILMTVTFIVLVIVFAVGLTLIAAILWNLFGNTLSNEAGAFLGGIFGFILAKVLGVVGIYAERAAVVEGLGWIDAFNRGWQVLKNNLGPTIVFAFLYIGIGIVLLIAFVVLGTILGIGLGELVVALFTNFEPDTWMLAPICCGGLLAWAVIVLAAGGVQTFESSAWTLAYREMIGKAEQDATSP